MILLDTHILIFDALEPDRLSKAARTALEQAADKQELACSDISLWEVAMLIARKRLDPQVPSQQFIEDLIQARRLEVLPITPAIAVHAQSDQIHHGDPADRLIAATAVLHRATLITADRKLRDLPGIATIW